MSDKGKGKEQPHPSPEDPDRHSATSPPAPSLPSRIASSALNLASSLSTPPPNPTSILPPEKATSSSSSSSAPAGPSGTIYHDRLHSTPSHLPAQSFRSQPSSSLEIGPGANEPWSAAFLQQQSQAIQPLQSPTTGNWHTFPQPSLTSGLTDSNFTSDLTDEFLSRRNSSQGPANADAETWIAQFHEAPLNEHSYYRQVIGERTERRSWREAFGDVQEDGAGVVELLNQGLSFGGEREVEEDREEEEVDASDLFGAGAPGMESSGETGRMAPDWSVLDPREGAEERNMGDVLSRVGMMGEWERMRYVDDVWGEKKSPEAGAAPAQGGPAPSESGNEQAVRRLQGVVGHVREGG